MIILKQLYSKAQSWFWMVFLFLVTVIGYKRQNQEIQRQREVIKQAEADNHSLVETIQDVKEVQQIRDDVGSLSADSVDEQLRSNGWEREDDSGHNGSA